MPGWFAVAGTFLLSMVSAYAFLWLRCRRTGPPFGRRAKWWATTVIVLTAIASTGIGVAAVVVSDHGAVFLGLVIPSGLLLGQVSADQGRRRSRAWLRALAAGLTFPLRRLYERMGDDLQDWCDTRLEAASRTPQQVGEAVQYYYKQVAARLRNKQALEQLNRWRESIEHKTGIIQLINLDTTPARLHAQLQWHPSTQDFGKYAPDDLPQLAERLETEAQNELYLLLAYVYRLGFHKLLIYPIRPSASVRTRRRPLAGRKAD